MCAAEGATEGRVSRRQPSELHNGTKLNEATNTMQYGMSRKRTATLSAVIELSAAAKGATRPQKECAICIHT